LIAPGDARSYSVLLQQKKRVRLSRCDAEIVRVNTCVFVNVRASIDEYRMFLTERPDQVSAQPVVIVHRSQIRVLPQIFDSLPRINAVNDVLQRGKTGKRPNQSQSQHADKCRVQYYAVLRRVIRWHPARQDRGEGGSEQQRHQQQKSSMDAGRIDGE